MSNPRGRLYPAFLVKEVMPFIEARYPVRRVPKGVAIGGASYGTLAALYAVIHRPGVFGAMLLQSGSLYVGESAILSEAESVTNWPAQVDLGIGTHEAAFDCDQPGNPAAVRDFERLGDMISKNAGTLHLTVEQCGVRGEKAYAH